jgi:hypothetical protein
MHHVHPQNLTYLTLFASTLAIMAGCTSRGQAPLEIARIGSEWRISCTGCGEASRLVQYRWQVLDETVPCRCD